MAEMLIKTLALCFVGNYLEEAAEGEFALEHHGTVTALD